MINWY